MMIEVTKNIFGLKDRIVNDQDITDQQGEESKISEIDVWPLGQWG